MFLILNPEYQVLFRNNCSLVKCYASVTTSSGTAGADILALQHNFCNNLETTEPMSTLNTL